MVISRIKKLASKFRLRKSHDHAPKEALVSGKTITVHLKDPYLQPEKPSQKAFKVDAPFTINPSSTRDINLKKVDTGKISLKKVKK